MSWLAFALSLLVWPSLVAEAGALARGLPPLKLLALLLALALPAAGAYLLIQGVDTSTPAGRRLRFWAHLATLAPVVATALRVPQGLPVRETWLGLFGAPLLISLLRSLKGAAGGPFQVAPPPTGVLWVHRWSAAVIASFAALHFTGHLSAAFSLALNTRVVDATRLVYKQPPVEALLLLALPVQIATGLWLFASAKDRARDRWDRLQLVSGLYLAVFIAAHATATAVLFRDINFRAASGGRAGVFGDPTFFAYYAFGPLAVFAHAACGARSLALRRLGHSRAGRLAEGVLGLGAVVTLVIALALLGVHVRNDRDKPQPRPARVGGR
jgi:hypothetical protein